MINDNVLPISSYLTNKEIDNFFVDNPEIILLIQNLNPNKAADSDGVSENILFK